MIRDLYKNTNDKKLSNGKIYARIPFVDIQSAMPMERGTRSIRYYLHVLVEQHFLEIATFNQNPFDRTSWYFPLKDKWP